MRQCRGPAWVVVGLLSACTGGEGEDRSSGSSDSSGTESETSGTSTDGPTTLGETETSATDTDTDTDGPCAMTDCDGECVDLDSASAHCGSCGFDCLGGACVDGECEAAELAASKGRLFMVEVDDEHLYYGGDGVFIGRMAKDGSDDVTIQAGAEVCLESAITPSSLVWSSAEAMGVRGCIKPECIGGVVQFYDGAGSAALAFSELYGRLFWSQDGDLFERDWPGGALGMLVSNQGTIVQIEVTDTHVYWLSENNLGDRIIRRIDILAELPVETLVGPRPDISEIAVGPSRLYWSEAQILYSAAFEELPLQGAPMQFSQAPGPIRDLGTDDAYLYWVAAEANGQGYVERCTFEICTVPERFAEPTRPWSLALDEVAVYWVTETGSIGAQRK